MKKNTIPAERRLMSYEDAASYLGISVRGMKQLAKDGLIRKTPIGARVLFDREDVDTYIERAKKSA